MDLSNATDELYAGGLEDFMPTRTRLVKEARADGDKALAATIGKLRKPSASAWAINMLVRSAPDEVERVLALGAAFRQAQDDLDGAELRELTRQRQTLITAVVEQVQAVARDHDRPIGDAIASEVEQTFRAAMADPDAAAAVRGGALTTAISGSGLGSLKISDVAASIRPVLEIVRTPAPSKGRGKGKPDPEAEAEREAREEQLERERAAKLAATELAAAERAAELAADRVTAAGEAVDRAKAQRTKMREALDELRKQVAAAEQDLATADDDVADAEEDRKTATSAAAKAQKVAKAARAALP